MTTDRPTLPEAKRLRAQELLLDALASGLCRTESCQKAGIARQTFYNWLLHDHPFAERARLAEEEALSLLEAALRRCAARAEEDPRYQRSLIYLAERQERRRRDAERRAERREEMARKDRAPQGRAAGEVGPKEFLRRAEAARREIEAGNLPPFEPCEGMPFFDKYLLSLDDTDATPEQIADVERRCAENLAARSAASAPAAGPGASPTASPTPAVTESAPAAAAATPALPKWPAPYEGVTATVY